MHSLAHMRNYTDSSMGVGSGGGAVIGQRGQRVLPGQFVHHGSTENKSSSRRPRSRDRRDHDDVMRGSNGGPTNIRSGPAGVQERMEWLDALADVKQRITSIETTNRSLAQSCAHSEEVTRNHTHRLQIIEDDIPKYKEYIQAVIFNHPSSIDKKLTSLDGRFEDMANTNAQIIGFKMAGIDDKIVNLEAMIGALFDKVSSSNAEAQSFQIGTPQASTTQLNHDEWPPLQRGQHPHAGT